MMCGGFGGVKQPDENILAELSQIKGTIETKLNSSFTVFEPVHYKSQVVAGTNLMVKIKVDGEKYIHVKYHRPLPCNGTELVLMDASAGHSVTSDL
jgi:cystatin-A/B